MDNSNSTIKTDTSRNLVSPVTGIEVKASVGRWYCLGMIVIRGMLSFRMQHILTLVTMAIGALALGATFFTGEGALYRLWEDLDRLMGNRVTVYADLGPDQILLTRRPSPDFTLGDFEYVKKRLADARYVSPIYHGRVYAVHTDKGQYMPVDGIAADLEREPAYRPLLGSGFSNPAREGFIWECMITVSASKILNIHLKDAPSIRIGTKRFRVIGIVADPPEADRRFQSRIVIPFFTAQLLWGRPGIIDNIVVSWNGADKMESTISKLRQALDECRAPDAYYLSSSNFKIKKRKNIVSNFIAFGTAQALFCILIASIGVVNVMLANVVRRMREFAIRIAMGAEPRDIMILVLAESCMLGLFGAALGIFTAILIADPLCRLISSKIPEASQLQPYISIKGILIPLIVCSLSGLIAGIIPAIKAKQLDILRILRAE